MFFSKEGNGGNVLPITQESKLLGENFNKIQEYPNKLVFWDMNGLKHINYVFSDSIKILVKASIKLRSIHKIEMSGFYIILG